VAQLLILRIDRFDACQVQGGVEQHGGVADREDEAVAIGPDGIGRIEAQIILPQVIDDWGKRHGRAGVARLACWTASIDNVRMVLMQSWSISAARGCAAAVAMFFEPSRKRYS